MQTKVPARFGGHLLLTLLNLPVTSQLLQPALQPAIRFYSRQAAGIVTMAMLLISLVTVQGHAKHIRELVQPDGTISRLSGYQGALDLSGFRVVLDPKRGPVIRQTLLPDGAFSALGTGMNDEVLALAVMGTNLYVGGKFDGLNDGGVSGLNYIAKWNGSTWSALGEGLSSTVNALAVIGNDLYAGGSFATGTDNGLKFIAKWNGTIWSPLDKGLGAPVLSMAVIGTNLYAGGYFNSIGLGGTAVSGVNYIAKWDGSAWSALDKGLNAPVNALTVMGNDLVVGGIFNQVGQGGSEVSNLNYIAKWNGTVWSALNKGLNAPVNALAAIGNDLFVGGQFSGVHNSADPITGLSYIAKWNGSAWSALDGGFNSPVRALAVIGTDLYAGGDFTDVGEGGTVVNGLNYVAKWNGSAWSPLDMGLINQVSSLAVLGNALYIGGDYNGVYEGGTDVSGLNYIAKWTPSSSCGDPVTAQAVSVTQTAVLSTGNCAVMLKGTGYGNGYTISGPNGYVFSAVYRNVGSYTINGLNVTQPGTYTLKVSYTDACGQSNSDLMTYVVTGTACK